MATKKLTENSQSEEATIDAITDAATRKPSPVSDEVHFWSKPFEISSLCRNDLLCVLSKDDARTFTDDDMQRIARCIEKEYSDCDCWMALETLAQEFLDEKKALVNDAS